MITRLRYPKGYQFRNANGAPLALGNLYYYVAGTTTPLDTYSDAAGTVPNTNPITLDGSGRLDVDVYLGSVSNCKEVLTTGSATVSPWPDDNIPLASQPDWDATGGPAQILNKPVLAAVATSGSYTDLSSTPPTNAAFTGDSGSGGTSGLVPAPAAGDTVANMFLSAAGGWATPPGSSSTAATNLTLTETASSVAVGSSSGTGITIPAASSTSAGVLDSTRASKIDGLATVATSGSYADLANQPQNMTGASASANGAAGFAPAPSAGQEGYFLRGDATWDQMTAAQIAGLAPSAATDTTNASNITSGTLAAGLVGDLSGTYLTLASASGTYAPLASPVLTGTPTAPTQPAGNNSTALATTAYIDSKLAANNGIATLDSSGRLTSSQIPGSLVGAVVYQGVWDASTNTPTLASGTGTAGNYYAVSVSGTASIDGIDQWTAGDAIIFDGTRWDKIDGASPAVLSVAGLTGAIAAPALSSALGLAASATVDTTNASNITSGTLAAGILPAPTSTTLGGVQSAAGATGQFMTGISTAGVPQFAAPTGARNVLLYGATGNGTTDDTAAINAAIAAAGAGGTVYFPNGTYKIGAAGLTLGASVKLLGASQNGVTLILGATSTQAITNSILGGTAFVYVAAGSVEFENITVNANNNAKFSIAFASAANNITLRSSSFIKGVYAGANFYNNSNVIITGCSFIQNNLYQMFFGTNIATQNVNISNNYFDPQGATASAATAAVSLWLSGSSSGILSNVIVSDNVINYAGLGAIEADGFVTNSCSQISITGNAIEMSAGSSTAGYSIEIKGTIGFSVSGNALYSNGAVGIVVETDSNNTSLPTGTISGNAVYGTSASSNSYGVYLSNGAVSVSDNYIGGFNIGVYVGVDPTIVANNVISCGTSGTANIGISYGLSSGYGTLIEGNAIYKVSGATYGIWISTATLTNLTIANNQISGTSVGVSFGGISTCSNCKLLFNNFNGVSTNIHTPPASGLLILSHSATGALQIGSSANGELVLGYALFTPTTYASLPSSPSFGMRACITDSTVQDTAANYGATVAGGGSYKAFVKYSGSNWVIG